MIDRGKMKTIFNDKILTGYRITVQNDQKPRKL